MQNKVNSKYFNKQDILVVNSILSSINDKAKLAIIYSQKYKNPNFGLLLSILFGGLGLDRIYSGHVILGIIKFIIIPITPLSLAWWIVDCILVKKNIQKNNFTLFMINNI